MIEPAALPVPQQKSKKRRRVATESIPGPGPGPESEMLSDEDSTMVSSRENKGKAGTSHPPITIKLKKVSASNIPSSEGEESDDFDRGVKALKGKGKASEKHQEQDGEDDEEEEEEDHEDEDDEEEGDHVKEEVDQKMRYAPRRGRTENEQPCDACIKRNKTCYTQDSIKARGACYECGRQRIKCIFSVSENFAYKKEDLLK